jgi:hypothetical protein
MRRFVLVSFVFLCLGSAASAQSIKEVEVTNLPEVQDVNVTNTPLPVTVAPPARFQLVGFTSATYNGDMGGHFGVTRKCQIEFPNSRMCSLEEVAATTAIPDEILGGARLDSLSLGRRSDTRSGHQPFRK